MCSVLFREGDWLVPYAVSADAPPDGSRRMRTDRGLAGRALQSREPYVIDNMTGEEGDPSRDGRR